MSRWDNAEIAVYMLADRYRGTLYIGVTSRLTERIWEHRNGEIPGFTRKYGLTRLVWFEAFERMTDAIAREKQFKRYLRQWKINLIERDNPTWDDLYPRLVDPPMAAHWTDLSMTVPE